MPTSRPSKHRREHRPLSSTVAATERRDGRWLVRSVPGAAALKTYRCPGCQQPIAPGTPHLVVWPAERGLAGTGTVEERRHWHTGCWHRHG